MSDLVVKYATENDDLKDRIAELEAENKRLHDLHLDRTKLTDKVLTERDRLRAALKRLADPDHKDKNLSNYARRLAQQALEAGKGDT